MDVGTAAIQAASLYGYSPLKEEQFCCITKFMEGNDVFCILPTGYRNTACFACLPTAFDLYFGYNYVSVLC
jgi:ATP-dependent DNA helicase RecQ